MNDNFDIDSFINEKFKKLEKKEAKQPKLNNHNNLHLENIIDNQIYNQMNIDGVNTSIETLLQPLFPSEKVFKSEFTSDKIFQLDKFIKESTKKEKLEKTNDTKLFLSQLKIDKSLTYSEMESTMHALWKQYISTLLNNAQQADTIYNKMLKADLHGSIIEVIDSINKNQINISGIVILETRRSFVIINKNDKLKTILKKGSTFRISLGYTAVKIIGDNFMYKAVERSKAKFKNKYILN
jgi:ribonuclease P protein subunit POP4